MATVQATRAAGSGTSGVISSPNQKWNTSSKLPLNTSPTITDITQTGSVLRFAIAAGTNSGTVSSTITVPDDAQFVAVSITTFESGTTASYISGGSMTFTKGGVDTAMTLVGGGDTNPASMTGAMAYLTLPDTGANKTLKYDFAGTVVSGFDILIAVTFWKGIDTASPVRSSDGTQAGAVPFTSGTLTCLSGDLILATAFNFGTGGADSTIDSWSNLTLLSQLAHSNGPDLALATGKPTGNTTVAASTGTNTGDGGICSIVLKPLSLPPVVSVSANVWTLKSFLNSILASTSSLTANTLGGGATAFQATAVLAATASLSVDTDQIWVTNPAVLAVTSSLTASTTQTWAVSSILAATSSLSVNGLAYDVASATLPCTSVVSCDAKVYKPAFATLLANTTLSFNASIAVRGAAVLPITSDLSAASQTYLIGRAILNSTSTLSVFGSQPFTFSTLGASSDLSTLVFIRWPSAAVLPFSSSIVADTNIKGTVFAAATLAPTSTLSCATIQRLAVLSVLPLNSSFFSDSIQRGNIFTSATFASTAALSCAATQRWTSVASLDSTASLIAGTIQRWAARAQYDAALVLKANVGQKWLSIAKLPGESVFSANANATSAGDVPIIFKSTSTLHVETIFVRQERHWRRHLTATGSTGLPKQIRGVRNRTTLSGNVS